MIRESHLGLAMLLLVACGQPPPATLPPVMRAPPPLHVTVQHEPLRGYRLAESFVARAPFRDGAPLRVGALVNGLRVRPEGGGLRVAESVAAPPLQAGLALPDALGGGLLFWNDSALYTADSFLGTLEPLLDVGFHPVSVSFAPNFVLVRGSNGNRLAIDVRTGHRVAIAPPLLADIATAAGGRAVALLEGGTCLLSDDAGKTYRALPLPVGAHAVNVREAEGQLIVGLTSDQQIRVDSAGKAQIEPAGGAAPARPATDSLWPLAEPPLERALAFGVPIGEEFAGVAVAGSVATVNLRTGELVQVTRALVPSELSCRTLDANGGLLLACNSATNGSVVLSDAFGERPRTEAKFDSQVRLAFAAGVLVASSRCDGLVRPGAVCVRSVDGRFQDYDIAAHLARFEQAPSPPAQPKSGAESVHTTASVVRWIPKLGGGAVAVVDGPMPGLLDAQTGSFVAISEEAARLASEPQRRPEGWLGLDWIAFRDGSVRGWLKDSAVAIASNGRLEPSVYEFRSLSGAGTHALAFDRWHRAFQSSDWGRSWVETLAPPGFASFAKLTVAPRCSQVGCLLGPWLRVGWAAEVPGTGVRTQKVVPAPPAVTRETLPVLDCKQLAAPILSEQPPLPAETDDRWLLGLNQASSTRAQDYEATFSWSTVHPINGTGEALGLRASLAIRARLDSDPDPLPANWSGYSALARISFAAPFEPNGTIQSASLGWRVLNEAARAVGTPAPSFEDERVDGLAALPVLGLDAGEAGGLLLGAGVPIWVRGSAAPAPLSVGTVADELTWVSAVQRAQNKLILLGGRLDGTLDVIEFTGGRARRLFQVPGSGSVRYPANPDALAIGPHGALAVLRTASGSEPASRADPALLLHEDGSVTALAPWSRLFLADAPECKAQASDYRALLQTSSSWLRLIDAAQPVTDQARQAGMFAMLRGNAERLCLEAVELSGGALDQLESSHQTRISARFVGRGKGAARLGLAPGFEFRQPLGCSLSSSR